MKPKQQPTAIKRALTALRAAGWPEISGIDIAPIAAELVAAGHCGEDAAMAVNAALAQLVAETFKSASWIDVDRCTAHLLVVRQRDQVRHFSIDYVLNTLAAVYGPPFPPHDNNNLH